MQSVDIIVVGAGIAGLSAAAPLAKHASVLVLEAEEAIGVHASGRSAAFAHFDMAEPVVRALTAASMEHFPDGSARQHPALFIANKDEMERFDQLEIDYREWAPHICRLDAEQMRDLVPILHTGSDGAVAGLLDRKARKLDADSMLQAHRKALKGTGGKLWLSAPVQSLVYEKGQWIVSTPKGVVSAPVVINAAGAWADRIADMAGISPIGISPKRRTVIIVDGPEGVDMRPWPFTKTVGNRFYCEPEGTGRLLVSPMDESPIEPGDAQPDEEDIARAAWQIEQATTLSIKTIRHRWAGLRSFSPDSRPVVGFSARAPGFFWLAGQGGFGLQTSPAMAMATCALVTHARWPDELNACGVSAECLSPARLNA